MSNKPKEEEEEVFDVSDVVESMWEKKPTTINEEEEKKEAEETPQEENQSSLKETIKDIRLKTNKDLSIEEYYEGFDYDELWLLTFEHLEYLMDTPEKKG